MPGLSTSGSYDWLHVVVSRDDHRKKISSSCGYSKVTGMSAILEAHVPRPNGQTIQNITTKQFTNISLQIIHCVSSVVKVGKYMLS